MHLYHVVLEYSEKLDNKVKQKTIDDIYVAVSPDFGIDPINRAGKIAIEKEGLEEREDVIHVTVESVNKLGFVYVEEE